MINLRNALMAGRRLPYDAEVEYLESIGRVEQFIDTGIVPRDQSTVEVELEILVAIGSRPVVFGTIESSTTGHAYLINGVFLQYFNYQTLEFNSFGNGEWRVPVLVQGTRVGCKFSQTSVIINENTYTYTKKSYLPTNSIYLFASNVNSGGGFSKVRVYYFKYLENSTVVRDFIPVRFTNENGQTEGAMYDRVTGELFRNQGTGAFIIGPDKVSSVGGV